MDKAVGKENRIIAVTGPTASGKTHHAVNIAMRLDGEIVSADSRQVYRRMDIGTGKDTAEYRHIRHHLIDVVDAGYKYNLFEYVRDAKQAADDITARGKLPVVCGGTGLYLETFLERTSLPEVPEDPSLREELENKSLDELKMILERMKHLHNVTDVDSKKRAIRAIEIQHYYQKHPETSGGMKGERMNALIIGVEINREERRKRISSRLETRLSGGMIEEVKSLLESGIKAEDLIYYGLEYKYLTYYLTGRFSYQEMKNGLEIAIHQFAKRQMTWFRGMERRGFKIHWLPYNLPDNEFVDIVETLFKSDYEA